jgi:hypothetical protein
MKQESIKIESLYIARSIKFGECFYVEGKILMRMNWTGFILISTLLNDVINRGDILVVDTATGNMFAYKGDTAVKPVISKILWSKE